jgi:hypothetical protein
MHVLIHRAGNVFSCLCIINNAAVAFIL